jgi:hypothetical protein
VSGNALLVRLVGSNGAVASRSVRTIDSSSTPKLAQLDITYIPPGTRAMHHYRQRRSC